MYKLRAFIRRRNLDRIGWTLLLLTSLSSAIISHAEGIPLVDGFWWSIVTLTTVGYGDIAPATVLGRMAAIVNMVIGMGVLGMLRAILASVFIERQRKEDAGMADLKLSNHIVLCQWNNRAARILSELRTDPQSKRTPIVLIAPLPSKPVDDPNLYFVTGQVSDETLTKAKVDAAQTVIILGDDNLGPTERDAISVLATLNVETMNPEAYTIVELVSPSNVVTCQRAKADEVIVTSELSSTLISQAALNHGISKVVMEVLDSNTGNQLCKIPLPAELAGRSFIEAFTQLKQQQNCIAVGIQKGKEGEVLANPPSGQQLDEQDFLIVISRAEVLA